MLGLFPKEFIPYDLGADAAVAVVIHVHHASAAALRHWLERAEACRASRAPPRLTGSCFGQASCSTRPCAQIHGTEGHFEFTGWMNGGSGAGATA